MLFRKMLRDMKHQKMQFISIFLMAFLGMFIYSGLCSEWYGIETYLDDYNAKTNLCDVWVYSENFTQEDIINVSNRDDVSGVERRLRVEVMGSGDHKPVLNLYFLEKDELNLPFLAEGSEIDLNDMQSIWMDYNFAKANDLSVGDYYSFKIGNVIVEKIIAGLVYSSEYTYYKKSSALWVNYKDMGFAFCPIVGFPIVEGTEDTPKYQKMNIVEILESMLNENYPEFIASIVDNHYDEIIEVFAQDNYDDFISKMVDENYYELVSQYIEDNYDDIIKEYISENKDFIIDMYVNEKYNSILDHYILKNRENLIISYVDENYADLIDTYVEQNLISILDDLVNSEYTSEQIAESGMTKNELRQSVITKYGEDIIIENAKKDVSKSQITKMLEDSLTHFDMKSLISELFTKDDIKDITMENLDETQLFKAIKKSYTADDITPLLISDYSALDIKAIIQDEYTVDDIKEIISDTYTTDEIKEQLHEKYPADEMLNLLVKQYSDNELQAFLTTSILDISDVVFNELLIKTDRTDLSSFESELDEILENDVALLLGRENVTGVWELFDKTESHKAISNIFPTAFIIIAILIIVTTMSRMVSSQRTQIGTLKALGFSRKKIMLHYLGYGFFTSISGSVMGVLIGANTFPYLLYESMAEGHSLPLWKSAIAPFFWIVAGACVLTCTVATFLTVRNVLAECPAQALRPKTSNNFNMLKIEENRFWKRFSFSVQWNLRDTFRSKVRTAMAIIGAMSTMAMLMCGFSIQDTLNDTMDWLFNDIQKYSMRVILSEDTTLNDATLLAYEYGGQLLQTSAVEIKNGTETKIVFLNVVEDTSLCGITDMYKNPLDLNDGDIAVSRKLAQKLKLSEGSTFDLRLEEGWLPVQVSVINCSPTSQSIVMTRNTLEDLGIGFGPNSIILKDDIEKFDSELVSAMYNSQDLNDAWNSTIEFMLLLTIIMIIAATLLAVVVLYNLGLLSFSEKERDFATLKVLGFKSNTLRRLLLTQNLWLSIIGILLGIPLGNWLTGKICVVLGSGYDVTGLYTIPSLMFCAFIVIVISITTNLMFSKKLKTLDMATALKTD